MSTENTVDTRPDPVAGSQCDHYAEEKRDAIPLVPIRGMGLFPGMVLHFDVGREKSMTAIDAVMAGEQNVFLAEQKDLAVTDPKPEDIFNVGCVAQVKQMLKMPDDATRALVEIKERAKITEFVQEEPYYAVSFQPIKPVFDNSKENKALIHLIKEAFIRFMKTTRRISGDFHKTLDLIDDPDHLIDLICANLNLEQEEAQKNLQEENLNDRLMMTYQSLVDEIEMTEIEKSISDKVKSEMEKTQRDYVLREQLKVIQEELDEGGSNELDDYQKRLDALEVSDEVREKVEVELHRLEKVPEGSPEAGVIETYIEWILDLPWNNATKEEADVKRVRKILNQDHYALDDVKERVLEYISVLHLSKSMKSPIICLVGPPGVGKTSIAKSIARALNRKYVRMSLGGMSDEAEIRGHRRTYIGAIPGRIIYHLKQAGTNNPLFLLDEIDKMSQDFRGDPASALLEVLDPEQNNTFTDNYLELPFDLSHVLFLTTANTLSTIPRPLLDRMEIIEVSGYIEDEKQEIAKRYLIPKQLEVHGMDKTKLKISKGAARDIIRYYTRESGVRELEREIAKICRVAAKELVEEEKEKVSVTAKNLAKYLGLHRFSFEKIKNDELVGVVNGLAWTSVGGETLEIEVVVVDGKGKVVITGQLGDVMQESAKAAISYIRSKADELGIQKDFYDVKDIHLHVPEGAVPKDGPSAGITMTTALISALTGKPVPQNLAMTGEITLRGRVLPIGGLREKLTAAHRAGITRIILPKENEKDLEEVPNSVTDDLSIHPVSQMEEVTALVFGHQK
ncbi:MAG: endopeptidase La [Eubacteriaceae bacterium]|nr:endopeptidase La [Eubacteriaceae bacterium]